MFNRRVYLDHASLTPVDKRVVKTMRKFSAPKYANASSWYKEGVAAKNAMTDSRRGVAEYISAHPDEIVFTSGGTEANNIAIIGVVEALKEKGMNYSDMHIIVSAIEHSSVIECVKHLEKCGVQVDFAKVDKNGIVDLNLFKKHLRENTVLVSIMTVNNEIGTVQPIREIAKLVRHRRKENNVTNDTQSFNLPIFHTDACQALYEDLNADKLGVDMLTLDGSKVYGPRGVGALYVRRNTPLAPITFGGDQESGLRSGTENIPAITGLAAALKIVAITRTSETVRLGQLREYFINEMKQLGKNISVNGDGAHVSPHIVNVSIPNIDNEFFVMQLDSHGIACSTKSSCLRDSDESYVLQAIGADSKNAIRFSLGRGTRMRDLKRAIKVIKGLI